MDLLRAIILGLVQGLTEFIPVSSSGHLVVIPELFGWEDQGLAFDAALHVGTLAAVLVYFWGEWMRMARSGLRDLTTHGLSIARFDPNSRLLLLIVAGSVPAAIVGLLFEDWIEENLRQAWLVALALIVVGILMLIAERIGRQDKPLGSIRLPDALVVGVAQACALFPGVSRSGATISAGLARGITRDDAARFAFLLGTPAFAGAAILKLPDLAGASSGELVELAAGMATAAIVGFIAIRWLLAFLRTNSLLPFVLYRFGLAAVILALSAAGTI